MSFAPFRYLIVLCATWLAFSAVILAPGAFRVTGHEVDLIQTLDIAERLVDGLRPHIDFMTPLGVLSFLPISVFLERGYGPGHAYLLAQALVTAVLLPGIWWVGISRLSGRVRVLFGVGMVALGTALIFGAANPSITGAMYYNRWAWIVAMMVVLVLMVPARTGWRAPWLDGVLLGLCGAALVLTKLTFVVALAPFVLLVLIRDRRGAEFFVALLVFLLCLGAATAWMGGFGFWIAYFEDLLAVSQLSARSFPGKPLSDLLASPEALPRTVLLLAVIVLWRRTGRAADGLALFVLAPGLIYITYQNWGNDPKWLFLLAVLLLSLPVSASAKPLFGVPAPVAPKLLAAAALLLFAPSMINIVTSHVRHMGTESSAYSALFPGLERADIEVETARTYSPKADITIEGDFLAPPTDPDSTEAPEPPQRVLGEVLPDCTLRFGLIGWTRRAVAQLGAFEEAVGKPVLNADNNAQLWMFGPFERLDGMAPWYYGTRAGFEPATHVLVPFCPVSTWSRGRKLEVIEEMGWTLEEVGRTDLFILLRRAG